jgi:hypothetical protein
MGSHGEEACVKCGQKEGLTWISWYQTKRGKGALFCEQHDAEEVERFMEERRS